MGSKRWSELSRGERLCIAGAATVQLSLLASALADLQRRPSDQVKGSKRLWRMLAFVNFVGPISYFLFGRRK
ncbi:PLDc_N domain-containing protein [Actinomadura latina]|uniref:PLDc_N domain-containing protein n=1 Tax=Actinomadura latina TaxID=163603 RepID=A0A846YZM2_9ACTN|nr:PLDc_N domain-containing protein [Actinomadura latina]